MNLNVNYIIPQSHANGPGTRYTLWVQGCSIHCPGCSNTDTWPFVGGKAWSVEALVEDIRKYAIDGVTITGGEPLDQYDAVSALLKEIPDICTFMTTGYILPQIYNKGQESIIDLLDFMCLGPYMADKPCKDSWKGSTNQIILYRTERGIKQSKMPVVPREVFIDENGDVIETGFSS